MDRYRDYKAILAAQLNTSMKALNWNIAKLGIGAVEYTLFDENSGIAHNVRNGKELVDKMCEACSERLAAQAIADTELNAMVRAAAARYPDARDSMYAELCENLRIASDPQQAVFYVRNRDLLVPFDIAVRFPMELDTKEFLDRVYDESILFVSLQRPSVSQPLDTITRALRECGCCLKAEPSVPDLYSCGDLTNFTGDTPELLRKLNVVNYFAYDIHDVLALEYPDKPEIQSEYYNRVIRSNTGIIDPARVVIAVNQLMEDYPEVCTESGVVHDIHVLDTFNRFADTVDIADIAKANRSLDLARYNRSAERE